MKVFNTRDAVLLVLGLSSLGGCTHDFDALSAGAGIVDAGADGKNDVVADASDNDGGVDAASLDTGAPDGATDGPADVAREVAPDVAPEIPPCTPPKSCTDAAKSCGTGCLSTSTSCVSACGANPACKKKCTDAEVTCRANCATDCVSCSKTGGCADPGTACTTASGT